MRFYRLEFNENEGEKPGVIFDIVFNLMSDNNFFAVF